MDNKVLNFRYFYNRNTQDFNWEGLAFVYTYAKICLLRMIHNVRVTRISACYYKCIISIDKLYIILLKRINHKICLSLAWNVIWGYCRYNAFISKTLICCFLNYILIQDYIREIVLSELVAYIMEINKNLFDD